MKQFQQPQKVLKKILQTPKVNYTSLVKKNQFIRFIFIGLINTIFGYSVFYFLLKVSSNLFFSTFLAQLLGILFNYKTIGLHVFNYKDNNFIIKFLYVYAFTFLLNFSCIFLFNKFFQIKTSVFIFYYFSFVYIIKFSY